MLPLYPEEYFFFFRKIQEKSLFLKIYDFQLINAMFDLQSKDAHILIHSSN